MTRGIISFVNMIEKKPVGVTVRAFRAIRHKVMRAMGEHWHAEMLPDHFAPNAAHVYKYKRRTRRYEERKKRAAARGRSGRRRVDSRADVEQLVFSGTLKDNVTRVAHIRTFEQRFKLIMPGTPYTPKKPKRPNQPPISDEVTRILQREKRALARIGKAVAREAIAQARSAKSSRL